MLKQGALLSSLECRGETLARALHYHYDCVVEEDFIFKPSAFKHSIAEADIRHAFEYKILDYAMPGEENKNLLLGLPSDGPLLEIIYNVLGGNSINVFHAMKVRIAYLDLLKTKGLRIRVIRNKDSSMKGMTEEEADYWDEYFTKNTIMPNLSKPGFFARKFGMMVKLDAETIRFLADEAEATHKSFTQIISDLVREKIAAEM